MNTDNAPQVKSTIPKPKPNPKPNPNPYLTILKPLFHVPQFYFPEGRSYETTSSAQENALLAEIFINGSIDTTGLKRIVKEVLSLPSYFIIFLERERLKLLHESEPPERQERVERTERIEKSQNITKDMFQQLWQHLKPKSKEHRAYYLLSSHPNKKWISINDFLQLLQTILTTHPSLTFLRPHPEFQYWYSLSVIARLCYLSTNRADYRISYRYNLHIFSEFKHSQILTILHSLENDPNINNCQCFNYEDFTIIYRRFWELDHDHDGELTQDNIEKYSGYTLSRLTLQRVFAQVAWRFIKINMKLSHHKQSTINIVNVNDDKYDNNIHEPTIKMSFMDFVWFILTVEDKSTRQSLSFWFKILDLDNDGILSIHELAQFYEEQYQRLVYLNGNPAFNFENIICQMVDVFKPEQGTQFVLEHFLAQKTESGIFINMLTDLNKLVAFEQRDAYEERNFKVVNPQWTEWDRFAKAEFRRIWSEEMEENDEEIDFYFEGGD